MKTRKATEIIIQGGLYTIKNTEADGLRITSEQKRIMAARFKGDSFFEIPAEKHPFIVDEIIFTICANAGCELPASEMLARYLSEELIIAVSELGYSHLTLEEIKLAIRVNVLPILKNPGGNDLKTVDATRSVSVGFLAPVLKNYCVLRDNLDRLIENKLNGY
jgi:hypothetical protein